MNDLVIIAIIGGSLVLIVLSILGRIWRRARDAAQLARLRSSVQQQRGLRERKQAELERVAARIIATSSSDAIAGFTIVRQIEAVFTDDHPSPTLAVQALKVVAAEIGANGIINLHSTRPPAGKCMAYGDAVIVRPVADASPPPETQDPPQTTS